jgi:NAD(P)-dependent dehydrogenase (short-subunit alcohol dehydrogenase family)
MAGRLAGQVAIITGASRGLGQYCALGFAKEGARVAIAARTEEQQDPRLPGTIYHTAKLIEDAGGEALPVVCNVADAESIQSMAEQVIDKWGRVDILMNNAAIQPPGSNADIQEKHWKLMFNVNVNGPFLCVRAVLPTMLKQQSGNIINISSGATQGGTPYGGSKRAVEAMSEGLAAELASSGITVNALKPLGAIETPGFLFAQVPRENQGGEGGGGARDLPPPDSYVEAAVLLACQTPDTYTGQVDDDAQTIAHLADDTTRARLLQLNPDYWNDAMNRALGIL